MFTPRAVDNIRKSVVVLSGGNSRGGEFIVLLLDSKGLNNYNYGNFNNSAK